MLPAEEKVATVFGGDTVDWVFDGGHVASRFISVKPKVATVQPTFTSFPITATSTPCSCEISGDADPHFDSKVFVTPGDKAGQGQARRDAGLRSRRRAGQS